MSADAFKQSIEQNIEMLHTHPRYIPFHAYTWGKHTKDTDRIIAEEGMTPLTIMGGANYKEERILDRELLS